MPVSKRNRRGLFVLLVICLTISYTPRLITLAYGSDELSITHQELKIIEEEILETKKIAKTQRKKSYRKASKYKRPGRAFDPNTYTLKDWMSLGLSEKQANVVLKFAKRKLRSNDDLKKIFVIPEELYSLIKDSTFYPEKQYETLEVKTNTFENISVDINKAGKEELMEIPGIGDFYARKIIEYRTDLGGFRSKQQLLEIWKFDEEKLNEVGQHMALGDAQLKKININTASMDELKVHPYISYKVANSIVKMREVHGQYETLEEITQSKLIDKELFTKLKPYLSL